MPLLLLVLKLFSSIVVAADPVDQYKNDYLYQRSIYQKNYADYQEKLQIHQKFTSISTKNDLFDSAKQTSQNRNLTLRTYLTLLRVQLTEYQDQHPDTTATLQKQLSDHESWLDLQNQLLLASTTTNINDINSQFSQTYPQIQQTLHTARVQIQINLQTKILNLLRQLQNDIQQTNPNIDPQWFTELDNQAQAIPQQTQKAYDLTQKKQYSLRFTDFYPAAQKELESSHTMLTQMQTNINTIIHKFF